MGWADGETGLDGTTWEYAKGGVEIGTTSGRWEPEAERNRAAQGRETHAPRTAKRSQVPVRQALDDDNLLCSKGR